MKNAFQQIKESSVSFQNILPFEMSFVSGGCLPYSWKNNGMFEIASRSIGIVAIVMGTYMLFHGFYDYKSCTTDECEALPSKHGMKYDEGWWCQCNDYTPRRRSHNSDHVTSQR